MTRRPLAERLWEKVDKDGPTVPHMTTRCWVFTGCCSANHGYGRIAIARSVARRAHRVSWELANGPIPDGLFVLHRCDNPPCVRPDHLFLGTQRDNILDMHRKGRGATGDRNGARLHPERVPRGERHSSRLHPERLRRGENHPQARLSDGEVAEIRRLYSAGVSGRSLATMFGVRPGLVSQLVTYKQRVPVGFIPPARKVWPRRRRQPDTQRRAA